MSGYIKIYRQLKDWEWYDDINTTRLFLHLLLSANFKDKNWKGITIEAGSLVIGRFKLSQQTGLSEQQVRTCLKKLKSTNEITIKSTNDYSIIKLNNWFNYQENNQQITNEQPTDNQQITTTKERNNSIKKESNNISKDIQEIVDCFEKSFNQKVRVVSAKRKKHIQARLKVFSLEEIKLAIENFSGSAFHTGENDRGWVADLDFIIRSDENIEKGLRLNEVQVKNSNRINKTAERCILISGLYFTERERDEIKEKEAIERDEQGYPRLKQNWTSLVSFKV